jgi:2-oxoglutarate dehydrogenase complex dehydrogenase (E1) component-like enzyme
MGVEQFVMGMAHRGRIFWQTYLENLHNIFGEFEGKITIKNILTVMLSII